MKERLVQVIYVVGMIIAGLCMLVAVLGLFGGPNEFFGVVIMVLLAGVSYGTGWAIRWIVTGIK